MLARLADDMRGDESTSILKRRDQGRAESRGSPPIRFMQSVYTGGQWARRIQAGGWYG